MRGDDFEEVIYERYSTFDPGTPSFTTTELKNQTGKLLAIAMREPVELTSHGRPKVFMVPVGLMRKFLTLEDQEDVRRADEAEKEGFLSIEESRAFLERLRNEASRSIKARPARTGQPAKKAVASRDRKNRSPRV